MVVTPRGTTQCRQVAFLRHMTGCALVEHGNRLAEPGTGCQISGLQKPECYVVSWRNTVSVTTVVTSGFQIFFILDF